MVIMDIRGMYHTKSEDEVCIVYLFGLKKHGWGKCWYLPVRTKSYDNGKQVVTEKPLMKMVN